MSRHTIGTDAQRSTPISNDLQEITLNSVREVLPDHAIDQACRDVGHRFRKRALTPIVTVLHMILAALWPEESYAASWDVHWASAVSHFPALAGKSPSSGSLAKARARLPLELWRRLFQWLSEQVQRLSAPFDKWCGHRVVLVDGTCVSMPDTPELMEHFGTSKGRYGPGAYPLARMVVLSLANTMTVLTYGLGRYRDDETTLLWPLLATLGKGDLLVGDRHFAAAHYYARYLAAGVEFLTRAHQRLKISRLPRIISYGANDFVTDLRINPRYRREDPRLPRSVRVRVFQAVLRVRGKRQTVWFVTSLLDAKTYPADQIAQVYLRRWRIETLLRQVKVRMSSDVLRSHGVEGIQKEVAARLSALNIVRTIMLEAATEHGVDPERLSFVHAVRAVVVFAPAFACEPTWKLPSIYAALLVEIASHVVPWRPGRMEPRAVRREVKHYPRLRTTREEWRREHAA